MTDNDYGGLVPDVDETFAFMGATLIAASALLAGVIAGAIITAAAMLR
ncbi:hypothetical protein [Mycobacterium sp. 1245801.1]|nr:hypothetical protein [Mycobacterium sp. 1245801.1]